MHRFIPIPAIVNLPYNLVSTNVERINALSEKLSQIQVNFSIISVKHEE